MNNPAFSHSPRESKKVVFDFLRSLRGLPRQRGFFIFSPIIILGLALLFGVGLAILSPKITEAATNISSSAFEHWAWNDTIGWIDFYYTRNVEVTLTKIKGYASSSVGYIAFDCATSPNPPAGCDTTYSNWKVSNDGNGWLSGWAWSEGIGWISFDCHNPETGGSPPDYSCITSDYRVKINPADRFTGWAWNDVVGWISFNCDNDYDPITPGIQDICETSEYKVVLTSLLGTAATGTLLSSIFDTGYPDGVAFNGIMWKCDASTSTICQPAGTNVKFQFASASTTTGFPEPIGPNGTSLDTDTYNPTGPGSPIAFKRLYHNNHRYFRYKIILESNYAQTASPRVDDVIVNWSP